MSDTPSTEDIRDWSADGFQYDGEDATYHQGLEVFDRWLAEHDRQVRAERATPPEHEHEFEDTCVICGKTWWDVHDDSE